MPLPAAGRRRASRRDASAPRLLPSSSPMASCGGSKMSKLQSPATRAARTPAGKLLVAGVSGWLRLDAVPCLGERPPPERRSARSALPSTRGPSRPPQRRSSKQREGRRPSRRDRLIALTASVRSRRLADIYSARPSSPRRSVKATRSAGVMRANRSRCSCLSCSANLLRITREYTRRSFFALSPRIVGSCSGAKLALRRRSEIVVRRSRQAAIGCRSRRAVRNAP